jgi:CRISPR system Cascade subunit CasC
MENMDKVYGVCAENRYEIDASQGKGTMNELLNFVSE